MNTTVPAPEPDVDATSGASTRRIASSRWGWPYSWVGSPLRVGLFILVFLTGFGNVALYRDLSDTQKTLFSVGIYAMGAAFLFHPRFKDYSIAVVAIILSIFVWFEVPRTDITSGLCVTYAAYLISAHSSPKMRKIWLTWLLAGIAVACAHMSFDFGMLERTGSGVILAGESNIKDWAIMIGIFLLAYAAVGFFWLWGVLDRRKYEREEIIRQRAEMSATIERTRIAREMHDIVAHNLAGIMALADGARYAGKNDPAVALEALETISAQSRASLTQMRGLLSVLREETPRELGAAPGTEDLATLIAEARRKEVNLEVTGMDSIPKDMSELAQFTLYRVVQELLTNIMRHSAGRRGTLRFERAGDELVISASNPVNAGAGGGSGYGLVGITERVRAHGGKFDYGVDGDTFTAVAKLPLS